MKAKTVRDVAAIVRDRRTQLGWTQAKLATQVGVNRDWVIKLEQAKPTIEWGTVLRALSELGLSLDLQVVALEPQKDGDELDHILSSTKKQGGQP